MRTRRPPGQKVDVPSTFVPADVAPRRSVADAAGAHVVDLCADMLRDAPDAWPDYVGASDAVHGDGLHLSAQGQRYVADKVLQLLPAIGLDRDALPADLPWGFDVDAAAPAASLEAHYARHRAALDRGSGVPPRRDDAPPEPLLLLRVVAAPTTAAFLAGLLLGVGLLLFRGGPRRRLRA